MAEVGKAYISVLPETKGLSSALDGVAQKTEKKISGGISRGMRQGTDSGARGLGRVIERGGTQGAAGLARALTQAARAGGQAVSVSLRAGIAATRPAVNALGNALGGAVKTSMAGAMAGVGAVGAQTLGGGLTRALGINDAKAKLAGLQQDVAGVSMAAQKSVQGTRFSTTDAVTLASQLSAAGQSTEQLSESLGQAVKLANVSGSSLGEIGYIIAQAAASGTVNMEDLNMMLDRGIPITTAMGKAMGKSVQEIKKLSSEGKLTFRDLQDGINAIDFDSTLYTKLSPKAGFQNLISQFSIVGQQLWEPLINPRNVDEGNIFYVLTNSMKALRSNPAFSDFINLLQTGLSSAMDKVYDFGHRLESVFSSDGAVRGFFDDVTSKFTKLKGEAGGLSAILAGITLGGLGSLLGSIPVLGQLFSGLNPASGGIIGAIALLSKESAGFRSAVGSIIDRVKELGGALASSLDEDSFVSAMDRIFNSVSNFISAPATGQFMSAVFDSIRNFSSGLISVAPSIIDTVSSIFTSFSDASGNGDAARNLGESIGAAIDAVLRVVQSAAPVLAELLSTAASALTSELAQTAIGAAVDILGYLAEHENVLMAGAGVLASIFVGSKMLQGVAGIASFVSKMSAIGGISAGASAATSGGVLASMFTSLGAAGRAAANALPGLATIAAVVVATGGIIALMDKMGTFDAIGGVLDSLAGVVTKVLPVIVDGISTLAQTAFDGLSLLVQAFALTAPYIAEAVSILITSASSGFESVSNSIISLIEPLASSGITAGAGAMSLAAGITALFSAFGVAAAVDTAGGLIGGIVDVTTLSDIINGVTELAKAFGALTTEAGQSGALMIESMAASITNGAPLLAAATISAAQSARGQAQAALDASPLVLKVQVQKPDVSGIGGGSVFSRMSGTVNNFTIQTQNNARINDMLRRAR